MLIDGNILNALAADEPTLELVRGLQANDVIKVLMTFVHVKEVNNTCNQERRDRLLMTLAALNPTWVGEETGEPQLDAVMGNKLRTLNNWADALITAAAAENAAAVVSDNYKDVKTAADRFAKAGGAKLEVWKYAGAHREVLRCRAEQN